jgi:hypothetical protein
LNKREINAMQIDPPASVPKGVGGWLWVLCFCLVVVAPITSFYHLFLGTFSRLRHAHTLRVAYLLTCYFVVFSAVAAYGFFAGLRLWLVKPGAVSLAKKYLWAYLLANLSYFVFWMVVMQPKQLLSFEAMGWYHVVGAILPFTLWYFYLEHSKRVRATYFS